MLVPFLLYVLAGYRPVAVWQWEDRPVCILRDPQCVYVCLYVVTSSIFILIHPSLVKKWHDLGNEFQCRLDVLPVGSPLTAGG